MLSMSESARLINCAGISFSGLLRTTVLIDMDKAFCCLNTIYALHVALKRKVTTVIKVVTLKLIILW